MKYIKLLEGESSFVRKKIIIDLLKKKGHKYRLERYTNIGESKDNIIIHTGNKKAKKEILVVAHYDVISGSPGANDNASAIAVIFNLLKRFKSYKAKNKIKFIIFGGEEEFYAGSGAYVKKHGIKNIIAVYDMELVGMGDMIGIWPITKAIEDGKALLNLRKTIKERGYYYEEIGNIQFWGDFTPFRKAGLKDAFCISVGQKKDKEAIRRFLEAPILISALRLIFSIKLPKLFQLYHSNEDKSKYLNKGALKMTSDVLYHTVISLDKSS